MCSVAGLDRNTVDRLCRSLGAGRLSMRTAKFKFAKSPSRRGKEAKDLDTSSPTPVCRGPSAKQLVVSLNPPWRRQSFRGQVANVLFPAGFTCGGTKPAIEKLCELAMKAARPVTIQKKCVASSNSSDVSLAAVRILLSFSCRHELCKLGQSRPGDTGLKLLTMDCLALCLCLRVLMCLRRA